MAGKPDKEKGAPAGASGGGRHRRVRADVVDVRYATAKAALSAWIDEQRERLGSTSIMWDPETDEVLPVAIACGVRYSFMAGEVRSW